MYYNAIGIMSEKQVLRKRQTKKRTIRTARNVLAHAVMLGLTATAGALLITAPGLGEIKKLLPQNKRNPEVVAKILLALYRRGLVTITGTRGARKALLTDKGKREAFLLLLKSKKLNKADWDKTWFMVSFDIPTERVRARDALRRKLKHIGFKVYQKSLYVYPLGCESEIDFLIEYYEVRDFVKYFYAADISDDAHFRRLFGLF